MALFRAGTSETYFKFHGRKPAMVGTAAKTGKAVAQVPIGD